MFVRVLVSYEEITREVGKAIPAIIKANQSVETFAGSFAFLTRNALNSAMAATSVARATELLYSRKAAEGLKKYGIALSDATGKTREMVDIIRDMLPFFRGKTIEQRVSVFHDMFGQGRIQARRFFDTVIPNFEEWARLVQEMKQAVGEGVFEKNFAFMMQQPLSKWQLLINRFQVLRIEIGEQIWKDVNKYLIPAIDKVLTWWEKLTPASKKAVVQITIFGTALMGLTSIVFGLLSALTLFVAIVTSFPLQLGAAGIALTVFGSALGNVLPSFVAKWGKVREAITDAVSKSVEAVQEGNYNIWSIWRDTFARIGRLVGVWTPHIQRQWNQAFEDWVSPLRWAWDNTIGAIYEMITDSQGKILQSYKDLFSEITTGLIGVAGFILGRDPFTKAFSAAILISQLDDMAPAIKKWYRTKGREDIKEIIGNIGTGIRDMLENELSFDFGIGSIPNLWAEGFLKYWRDEWKKNISPDLAKAVSSFTDWWDKGGREFTTIQFEAIWESAIKTINTVIHTLLNILKTIAYIFGRFSGMSEDQLKRLRDFENTDWNLLITSITDPITSLLGIVRSVLTTISSAISFDNDSVSSGMKELNKQLLDVGPKIVRGFFGVIEATLAGIGIIAASGLNLEPAVRKTAEQIILSLHGLLDKVPVLNWFIRDPNAENRQPGGLGGPLPGTLNKIAMMSGILGLGAIGGYGMLRGGNAFAGIGKGFKGFLKGGLGGGLAGAGVGGLAHILLGLSLGAMPGFGAAGAIVGAGSGAVRGFRSVMGKPIRGAQHAAGTKFKENILRGFGVETPKMTKDRVKAEQAAGRAAKNSEKIFENMTASGADKVNWPTIPRHPMAAYNEVMNPLKKQYKVDTLEIEELDKKLKDARAIYKGRKAEADRMTAMVDVTIAEDIAKAQETMSRASLSKLNAEGKKRILEATNIDINLAEVQTKIRVAQTAVNNLESVVDDTELLYRLTEAKEKLRTLNAEIANLSAQGSLVDILEEHGEHSLKGRAATLRAEMAEITKEILQLTEPNRLAGVSGDVQLQLDSARVKLNSLEVAQVKLENAVKSYDAQVKRQEELINKSGFSEKKQKQLIEEIKANRRAELKGAIAGKQAGITTSKENVDKLTKQIKELTEGRDERFKLGKKQADERLRAESLLWTSRDSGIVKHYRERLAKRFGVAPGAVDDTAMAVFNKLPGLLGIDKRADLMNTLSGILKNRKDVRKPDVHLLWSALGLGKAQKYGDPNLVNVVTPTKLSAIQMKAQIRDTIDDVIRKMFEKAEEVVEEASDFADFGRASDYSERAIPYLSRRRYSDIVGKEAGMKRGYDFSRNDYFLHYNRSIDSLPDTLYRGSKVEDMHKTFFSDSETIARRYDKGRMSAFRMDWKGLRVEEAPSFAISSGSNKALEEYFKDSGIDVLINSRHQEYLFLNDKARSRLVEQWTTLTGRGFTIPTTGEIDKLSSSNYSEFLPAEGLPKTLYRGSPYVDGARTFYSTSKSYAGMFARPKLVTGQMDWEGLNVFRVAGDTLSANARNVRRAYEDMGDAIISTAKYAKNDVVLLTRDAVNSFIETEVDFFDMIRDGVWGKLPRSSSRYKEHLREMRLLSGDSATDFAEFSGLHKPQVISFEQFMNLKEIQKTQLPSMYLPELIRIFQRQYPDKSMKEFIEEYFKRTGVHLSTRFEQVKDIWTNPAWDADMRRNINTVPMEGLDNVLYRGSHLQDDFSSYFSGSKKYVEEGPYAKPLLSTYKVTDWSGLDVKQIPNFLHGNIGGRERINFAGRADVIVTRTKDGINNYAFISKKALKRLERFNVEFYKWGERLADDSDEVAEYTEILRRQRVMAEKVPFLDEELARRLTDAPDLYRSMSSEYSAVTRGFFPDRLYGSGSTFSAYVDHDRYPLKMEGWDKLNVRAGQGYLDMFSEDELKKRLKGSGVDVLMDTKSQRFVFLTDRAKSNLEEIMSRRASDYSVHGSPLPYKADELRTIFDLKQKFEGTSTRIGLRGAFGRQAKDFASSFTRNWNTFKIPPVPFDELLEVVNEIGQYTYGNTLEALMVGYRSQYGNDFNDFLRRVTDAGLHENIFYNMEDYVIREWKNSFWNADNIELPNIFFRGADFNDDILSYYAEDIDNALTFTEDRTLKAVKLNLRDMSLRRLPDDLFIEGYDLIRSRFSNVADVIVSETGWSIFLITDYAMRKAEEGVLGALVGRNSYADALRASDYAEFTSGGEEFLNEYDKKFWETIERDWRYQYEGMFMRMRSAGEDLLRKNEKRIEILLAHYDMEMEELYELMVGGPKEYSPEDVMRNVEIAKRMQMWEAEGFIKPRTPKPFGTRFAISSGDFVSKGYDLSNSFETRDMGLIGSRIKYPDFEALLDWVYDAEDFWSDDTVETLMKAYKSQFEGGLDDFMREAFFAKDFMDVDDLKSMWDRVDTRLSPITMSDIVYRVGEFYGDVMDLVYSDIDEAIRHGGEQTIKAIRIPLRNLLLNRIPDEMFMEGYDAIENLYGYTGDILVSESGHAMYLATEKARTIAHNNIIGQVIGSESIDDAARHIGPDKLGTADYAEFGEIAKKAQPRFITYDEVVKSALVSVLEASGALLVR